MVIFLVLCSAECVREVLGRSVETQEEDVLCFIATALYYKVVLSQTCCCTNKVLRTLKLTSGHKLIWASLHVQQLAAKALHSITNYMSAETNQHGKNEN